MAAGYDPVPEVEQELEFLVRVKTYGKVGEVTLRPVAHHLMQSLHRTFGNDRIVVVRLVKDEEGFPVWKRVWFDPLVVEGGKLTL